MSFVVRYTHEGRLYPTRYLTDWGFTDEEEGRALHFTTEEGAWTAHREVTRELKDDWRVDVVDTRNPLLALAGVLG